METNEIKPALPENQSRLLKTLAIIATATALILVAVLATRPVSSFDIGYHLAYGEYFLDNFKIVQTNRFIYTHLRSDLLSNPDNLGPGCWYDSKTGTYHFVNANWLSQVIMAAVYRLGGIKALSIFQTIMIVRFVSKRAYPIQVPGLLGKPVCDFHFRKLYPLWDYSSSLKTSGKLHNLLFPSSR